MSPAALALATALLLPAFQPAPTLRPEPLLWETPVSWTVPLPPSTGLVFPPAVAAQVENLRKVSRESGPSGALAALAKAEAPELLLLRALLKERSFDDWPGALADYEAVLKSPDRSWPRAMALDNYKELLRKRIEAGEKSLYGALIQCLKDEWRNEEALTLLPTVLADPQVPAEMKKKIRRDEPIMELRLGRYDRAAELWGKPADRSETQWLSQTEYRRGNFARAAEIRVALAKNSSGRARTRELTAAFNILTRAGLFAEAVELAAQYPELKKIADYDWRLGLAALAAQDLPSAQTIFEAIIEDKNAKNRHPGARYYLGRTLSLAGKGSEARAAYRAAASGPVNYYSILAKGQLEPSNFNAAPLLEKLLVTGPSGRDQGSLGYHLWITEKAFSGERLAVAAAALAGRKAILAEGRGRADRALNERLKTLLAARDWDALSSWLRYNDELAKNPAPEARDLWPLLAASLSAQSGRYRAAFSFLSRIPSRPGAAGTWGHPLVYSREALTARREHGLSPALLLALIRTESAYQPDIMSASNARGLMQLLPATAEKVAARLGQPAPTTAELFDPAANIRLGSWYLAALIDGFGEEALALAGYNGGPYNIKSLIAAKPAMPLDVFIDTLPFEETVNYVQRITLARYLYEIAYTGRAHLPDLTGPVPSPKPTLPDF